MKYDESAQVELIFSLSLYAPISEYILGMPSSPFEWQMALRKESLALKGMCNVRQV
jgi:hypothetical protein